LVRRYNSEPFTEATPTDVLDLHCHLLPGLDDGPPDLDASLALALGLERLGFTEIIPTPHQKAGAWAPSPEAAETARAELVAALAGEGSLLQVHPAAGENMWDELFLERQAGLSFPCYPSGRAFLLEFLDLIPPSLHERLFELRVAGRLPVIAHVERYPDLLDRSRLERLGQTAALLVNLSSLGSGAGFFARRRARGLVEAGLIHAVASDAHRVDDLPAAGAGLRWLRDRLGEDAALRLLTSHPRRIIAGDLPESGE
jgi:protein-tyrosine phosphatase